MEGLSGGLMHKPDLEAHFPAHIHPPAVPSPAPGRRFPSHPVHRIIYTMSIPLPNVTVTGDASDTRDPPTGTI